MQNFLSAATDCGGFALSGAFTRQNAHTLGTPQIWYALRYGYYFRRVNYRAVFIQQGVPQTPRFISPSPEGAKQLLPMGPAASQEAIKMLGTNGGGFFNANSSHPFETPPRFSTNRAQMLAIF